MRKLLQVIDARGTQDGDGVNIHRVAGRHLNKILDPYLMIDEINSDQAADYIGGFPEHPHRGFETITYMKAGRMRHRDHMGNEGVIEAGDVQWMTAGRGVLHAEMPEQESGLLHGFQVWLNLPAREKMKPAAYREIASANIPQQLYANGAKLRAIAGAITSDGQLLLGALPELSTEPVFLDLSLPPNAELTLSFNDKHPALVYVYQGDTDDVNYRQVGFYSAAESLQIRAGDNGAELLILSGKPIDEPIAQRGPFVMNTEAEIEQAISDFYNNRLV